MAKSDKHIVLQNNIDKVGQISNLFQRISERIEQSRNEIVRNANAVLLINNYEIGRYIVEDEQQGANRAEYGKYILVELSKLLTHTYGKGWSVRNLKYYRSFYKTYSNWANASAQFKSNSVNTFTQSNPNFVNVFTKFKNTKLSWSHYLILMRIENADERSFYEIEASEENWSVRQLQRQVASSLYERLALSRDKEEVMRLAREGQKIQRPTDILKNPFTLEFLGLKAETAYSEKTLETAIISKLQDFLLELGKGFLFEARQKRFTFDEDNFYVDLVFYNRLLQCYVLIDLKIDKLSHQDLGQMQMYVNYYDRYVKQDFEKPTIGILLCKEQDKALVELTLPQNANIYASDYALYLPDKQVLQDKLNEWVEEIEENKIN
ncbi:MAG: DUF1016 family protein [Flavobacteriaceae bacterium]|nr:DUF1016 family protein [Flavobacteriaceae bacterium]